VGVPEKDKPTLSKSGEFQNQPYRKKKRNQRSPSTKREFRMRGSTDAWKKIVGESAHTIEEKILEDYRNLWLNRKLT